MRLLYFYFLAINIFSFLQTGYDKRSAIRRKNRISERSLLIFVALGGTLGASIGMLLFRHKTSKRSYLIPFFGIVLLQVLVFYACFNF
jgi:uncharacterized membrane protein YsdA (DUF1294 family)